MLSALLLTLALQDSMPAAQPPADAHPPLDVSGATLYEVNVRQFSPDGDFDGVRRQLPRLEALGVEVLWLMPIHPIGELNRKGSLGSYYAASDYRALNPEYGDAEDFRALVDEAHARGMHVILDWVANHTGWDHVWTESNPEYFSRGEDGGFVPPNADWSDVIDLDYDQPGTRRAMTDAMKFWVEEFGVDGFRCDVAELVPRDFWEGAIAELRQLKPLFMLAEGHEMWLYEAGFDATYGWGVAETVLRVVEGQQTAADLQAKLEAEFELHRAHPSGMRIHFTTNHDWNTWHGLAVERLGGAWELATVLSFLAPGMPLIYGGQEAGLEQRLEFFERDPIEWRPHPHAAFLRALTSLKSDSDVLQAPIAERQFRFTAAGVMPEGVLAFGQQDEFETLVCVMNLTPERVELPDPGPAPVSFTDAWGFPTQMPTALDPWGWHLVRFRAE